MWTGSGLSDHHYQKYGLIIGKNGVFFKILWENGKINGNIEKQMKVINESR
jgi:hypothetical protein